MSFYRTIKYCLNQHVFGLDWVTYPLSTWEHAHLVIYIDIPWQMWLLWSRWDGGKNGLLKYALLSTMSWKEETGPFSVWQAVGLLQTQHWGTFYGWAKAFNYFPSNPTLLIWTELNLTYIVEPCNPYRYKTHSVEPCDPYIINMLQLHSFFLVFKGTF